MLYLDGLPLMTVKLGFGFCLLCRFGCLVVVAWFDLLVLRWVCWFNSVGVGVLVLRFVVLLC